MVKINEPTTENEKTKTPVSTPKIDEEVTRAEEHPKFEKKTFKERKKEIPYSDHLFHPWEIPEEEDMDEEMELLCETLDILSDIGKTISVGVQETVKREYFE
jgi:hypothetical protein